MSSRQIQIEWACRVIEATSAKIRAVVGHVRDIFFWPKTPKLERTLAVKTIFVVTPFRQTQSIPNTYYSSSTKQKHHVVVGPTVPTGNAHSVSTNGTFLFRGSFGYVQQAARSNNNDTASSIALPQIVGIVASAYIWYIVLYLLFCVSTFVWLFCCIPILAHFFVVPSQCLILGSFHKQTPTLSHTITTTAITQEPTPRCPTLHSRLPRSHLPRLPVARSECGRTLSGTIGPALDWCIGRWYQQTTKENAVSYWHPCLCTANTRIAVAIGTDSKTTSRREGIYRVVFLLWVDFVCCLNTRKTNPNKVSCFSLELLPLFSFVYSGVVCSFYVRVVCYNARPFFRCFSLSTSCSN